MKDCDETKKSHHLKKSRLESLIVNPKMQASGRAGIDQRHWNKNNSRTSCTDDGIDAI